MKKFLFIFLFITSISLISQNLKKELFVKYTTNEIRIDGILNENDWDLATGVNDFYEYRPEYDDKPKSPATIKILNDDRFLYVGIKIEVNKNDQKTGSLKRDFDATVSDFIALVFDTFNDADHYLFSVPMWNFNIPYKLKHYIDIVTQPGMSWSYSPDDGYKGLMTEKTATVIYATGDGYSEGTGFESFDLQKPYVNLWLTFLGFKKIDKVIIDRTLFDAETAEKNALDVALKLANINTL